MVSQESSQPDRITDRTQHPHRGKSLETTNDKILEFADFNSLAALRDLETTYTIAGGQAEWEDWSLILRGLGYLFAGFLFIVTLCALIYWIAGEQILIYFILAVAFIGVPIVAFLRLRQLIKRPFDLMVVHDDRISVFRDLQKSGKNWQAKPGPIFLLSDIQKVVYRTSFWKKWMVLILADQSNHDGQKYVIRHTLLFRRRAIPGVEIDRMRTAADIIGRLGVKHKFSYALAIATASFATLLIALNIASKVIDAEQRFDEIDRDYEEAIARARAEQKPNQGQPASASPSDAALAMADPRAPLSEEWNVQRTSFFGIVEREVDVHAKPDPTSPVLFRLNVGDSVVRRIAWRSGIPSDEMEDSDFAQAIVDVDGKIAGYAFNNVFDDSLYSFPSETSNLAGASQLRGIWRDSESAYRLLSGRGICGIQLWTVQVV
jgi:hypothetical protein